MFINIFTHKKSIMIVLWKSYQESGDLGLHAWSCLVFSFLVLFPTRQRSFRRHLFFQQLTIGWCFLKFLFHLFEQFLKVVPTDIGWCFIKMSWCFLFLFHLFEHFFLRGFLTLQNFLCGSSNDALQRRHRLLQRGLLRRISGAAAEPSLASTGTTLCTTALAARMRLDAGRILLHFVAVGWLLLVKLMKLGMWFVAVGSLKLLMIATFPVETFKFCWYVSPPFTTIYYNRLKRISSRDLRNLSGDDLDDMTLSSKKNFGWELA